MDWDLGVTGVGLLLAMSLGFGLLAQLTAGRDTTAWMWLIGSGTFFVSGLLISEAWFGWATEADLQPNYDGLSFDETLLALLPSILVVVVVRLLIRRHRHNGPQPLQAEATDQLPRRD
jgi:zinc transporter ZupT